MVYNVSQHASLVHYWAWLNCFHFMIYCFFINGHGVCCLTSCFIFSSLLSGVCVVSCHFSLVHYCLPWFILFHLCFISLTLQGMVEIASRDPLLVFSNWACFILFQFCFTGSSLLGIVCIVSPHDLLVRPYWVWYVLLHFPRWFIITGYGTFCFTSLTGSSLLGILRFVALPPLVHHVKVSVITYRW
jgi:hypothetical protein